LLGGQPPLVDHDDDAVLPRHRRQHEAPSIYRPSHAPPRAAAYKPGRAQAFRRGGARDRPARGEPAAGRGSRARRGDLARAGGGGEDVAGDRDLPPFDRSAMDGYALRAADVAGAPCALEVVGEVRAGDWPTLALQAGQAAKIMTGAPLPAGATAVQQVEKTR